MSLPWVSIVIPTFNRAELVAESLHSAQAQTGLAAEIIVVDDGSHDGSDRVVEDLAGDDRRIRLIRTAHGGPAAARNAGVAAACGEYLTFLDSDEPLALPGGSGGRSTSSLPGGTSPRWSGRSSSSSS